VPSEVGAVGSRRTGSGQPSEGGFDSAHRYSLAPEARRKRAIDLQIIRGDCTKSGAVRIDNADYLKS
jgi:hypothetical protein